MNFWQHIFNQNLAKIKSGKVMFVFWQCSDMGTQTRFFLHSIDCLLFYVPYRKPFTQMEMSLLLVTGCNFRPLPGAQDLWSRIDLYRATYAVAMASVFPFSFEGPPPFSRLLRHEMGCWGPINSYTSPHLVAAYDTQRNALDLCIPGSSEFGFVWSTVPFSRLSLLGFRNSYHDW
jgi:hypothetical protein